MNGRNEPVPRSRPPARSIPKVRGHVLEQLARERQEVLSVVINRGVARRGNKRQVVAGDVDIVLVEPRVVGESHRVWLRPEATDHAAIARAQSQLRKIAAQFDLCAQGKLGQKR